MSVRPESSGVGVVLHVAEILEPFGVVAVTVHEIVFVNLKHIGEDSQKWEENLVMDVLCYSVRSEITLLETIYKPVRIPLFLRSGQELAEDAAVRARV